VSRCTATTAAGAPCRSYAMAGGDRCRVHLRPAPDAEAVAQLVSMLRAGNYLEVAAIAAGVTVDELLEHEDVVAEIEAARAEAEVRGIARIATAASENWQAAAWLLERQYPDRWGRPAVRQDGERAPAPAAGPDRLDELARRRDARRAVAP
jgi:hypothetical protein